MVHSVLDWSLSKSAVAKMGARSRTVVLLVAAFLALAHSQEVLDLNPQQWSIINKNGSLKLNSTLPAYPVEVLRADGVIKDTQYRQAHCKRPYVMRSTAIIC